MCSHYQFYDVYGTLRDQNRNERLFCRSVLILLQRLSTNTNIHGRRNRSSKFQCMHNLISTLQTGQKLGHTQNMRLTALQNDPNGDADVLSVWNYLFVHGKVRTSIDKGDRFDLPSAIVQELYICPFCNTVFLNIEAKSIYGEWLTTRSILKTKNVETEEFFAFSERIYQQKGKPSQAQTPQGTKSRTSLDI